MTTPVVANIAPADGVISKVAEPQRFSIRDDTSTIARDSVFFHLGTGPVLYRGGVLPEEVPNVDIELYPYSGNPTSEAARSILPSGALRIDYPLGNSRGTYRMGGLQSPAIPEASLMMEFKLQIEQANVFVDGNNFTGVRAGFKINGTGISLKFFSDGATRSIEIHQASFTTPAPPSAAYTVDYDWDQGVPHSYKILWHPPLDQLRLYVSSNLPNVPDTLLIDATISAIATPLAPNELPAVQPEAFFGHGHPTAASISDWFGVDFYNIVSTPLVAGIPRGGHLGFIRTDDTVDYRPTALPRDADQPWIIIPDSFHDIGGKEIVTVTDRLQLIREDITKSLGFYRVEPQLPVATALFDFKVSGVLIERDPTSGQATGMEIYIDDGVRQVRVALLDNDGTQSIGMLNGTTPAVESAYVGDQLGWAGEGSYRIFFDPYGTADLLQLVPTDEGVDEDLIASIPYGSLPVTELPGPGLGFLHNGLTIAAQAILNLGRLRYSLNVRNYDGGSLPSGLYAADPVITGVEPETGDSLTSAGRMSNLVGVLTLTNDVVGTSQVIVRDEPGFDSESGTMLEFRARVDSYTVGELSDPIREVTGVGLSIDDSTFQQLLMFAEAGPDLGKILFFSMDEDPRQHLLDIRSGKEEVKDTYVAVDWSLFHLYRLEKTIGGRFRLFIDDNETPSIDLETLELQPQLAPTAGNGKRLLFGSLLEDRETVSSWRFVRHSFSGGFDISATPVLSENEVLARFEHAVNVIAEGQDDAKILFTGTPGQFDITPEPYEDFEEDWPDTGPLTLVFGGSPGLFTTP